MHHHSYMSKTQGWQTRLLTTIEEMKLSPFAWGQNDCCIFAFKCLDAQYGTKIAEQAIGEYDSILSCKRFMLKRARTTSLAPVIDTFVPNRVDINLAQRGDLVTFEGEQGETASIMWSGYIWAMGPDGVVVLPLNKVKLLDAWRC